VARFLLMMTGMIWFLLGSIAAAADERVAHVSVEGTALLDVEISPDARWVGFVEDGSAEVRFLDTWTWQVHAYAPCPEGAPAGLGALDLDAGLTWFVGCPSGTVAILEETQEAFDIRSDAVEVDTDQVLLVVAAESDILVIGDPGDGGNPKVHHIDPLTLEADTDSAWPSTLGYSGLVDAAADADDLVICHAGDSVSRVDIYSGSAVIRDDSAGAGSSCGDVIFAPGESVLISGDEGGVLRFATESNDLTLVIDDDDGLEVATALTVHSDEEQLIVADSGREEFVYFIYSSTSGNPGDVETMAVSWPEGAIAGEGVVEMVTWDGYSAAITDLGSLWILTDRPWIDLTDLSGSQAIEGDVVSVEFTSDTSGDWSLYLGGPASEGGELIESGEADAGEVVTVDVTIGDGYSEGSNTLWVELSDADGSEGHAATSIDVDNPPEQVSLSAASIGFGNQQITLSFEGVDDEDLVSYMVYISLAPFEASDYSSGGPVYDGLDEISPPFEINASPGEAVIYTISPLTNRVTYYVAVRAVDASGLEGPMSDVVEAMPLPTKGASALAGDEGGFCGTPLPASGALALLGGLALLRRRQTAAAAGALLVVSAASPQAAEAGESDEVRTKESRNGSLEVRYGPIWMDDPVIQAVFGETGQGMLWVGYGPHIIDQLQITVGAGFYQELGYMLADTEACSSLLASSDAVDLQAIEAACDSSSEHDMLSALPLTLDLELRLDFFEDQLLVPTGSVGGDYWLWRENWYVNPDVGGEDSVSGGKTGWHWSGGLDILLDRFEPSRASVLQARSGIDNTWLSAEYRQQAVGSEEGLSFSGRSLTVGLRFDF
jgi:hypothetical protein